MMSRWRVRSGGHLRQRIARRFGRCLRGIRRRCISGRQLVGDGETQPDGRSTRSPPVGRDRRRCEWCRIAAPHAARPALADSCRRRTEAPEARHRRRRRTEGEAWSSFFRCWTGPRVCRRVLVGIPVLIVGRLTLFPHTPPRFIPNRNSLTETAGGDLRRPSRVHLKGASIRSIYIKRSRSCLRSSASAARRS